MKYDNLFNKGKIGNLNLKNRIVMPAMGTDLAKASGEASDELIKYYEERAKGGCGLIITEITRIDNETGVGTPNQLSAISGKHIPRLERLARSVHKYDTKIFLQLHHPGRQAPAQPQNANEIVAPSPIQCKTMEDKPRKLTTEEIKGLVKKFVRGAKIAQSAGIDGVELHGAHGYLIGQFLSPATNKRTDRYGGSFSNRMRFLSEIILGIKDVCGQDFPVSVRIDGDEFVEGGIDLEEAIKIAQKLDSYNIDAINVSSGTYESAVTIIEPMSYQEGWKTHLAQGIKNNVNVPVITCNAIKTPEFADQLIAEDNCDFVALGRAQLADPAWGKKAMEGNEEKIRPCIGCLHCIEQVMNGTTIECAVNPEVGYEREYEDYNKIEEDKSAAIIGAGPAGMQSAITLAKRGVDVTLFEKSDHLGGKVYTGSIPPHKDRLKALISNMKYEIEELNIDLKLNCAPDIKDLKELNPDSVFIATGGNDIVPPLPGADNDNVLLATDLLENEMQFEDKNIAIVGSGMTGLETAEYLSHQGNDVKVIEMMDKIGPQVYEPILYDIQSRIQKLDIELLTSRKLTEIKENKIIVQNTKEKNTENIEADIVVLAIGVTDSKNDEFVEKIEDNFANVKLLGDSDQAGKIYNAVKTGFDKAFAI